MTDLPASQAAARPAARALLVISQVYVPDPAAVGQHVHDAAAGMAQRGWRVRVLTSARGYDDPTARYPRREQRDGVEIRRMPLASFGKRSIPVRLLGAAAFLAQVVFRGLFMRRLDAILVSTSPPMASAAALLIGKLRRVPIKYWVMDLNPDQAIAMGRVKEGSLPARAFEALNRLILRHAQDVIALDRFMAERLNRKLPVADKLAILPPWPLDHHLQPIAHEANPFRKRHGLEGQFVVMYSGNHSPASPLDTVLEAALRLQDEPRLRFVFVGGGSGKRAVEDLIAQHRPANVLSLPYQPLDQIKYSLSAADVHLVSLGQAMAGIIHPCKVYGAMSVGRPILLLGPEDSHLADLLRDAGIGWRIAHGDVDGAVATLRQVLATEPAVLAAMGRRAREAVEQRFSMARLRGALCDVLEGKRPAARLEAEVR